MPSTDEMSFGGFDMSEMCANTSPYKRPTSNRVTSIETTSIRVAREICEKGATTQHRH